MVMAADTGKAEGNLVQNHQRSKEIRVRGGDILSILNQLRGCLYLLVSPYCGATEVIGPRETSMYAQSCTLTSVKCFTEYTVLALV